MIDLKNSLTALFFISALLFISMDAEADDLIRTTCRRTPDRRICESSLRSDPRSATAATAEALIPIMIDVVRSEFTASLAHVNALIKQARDPGMARALRECAWLYKVVLEDNVVVAVKAVKLGDPKFGEEAMIDSGNEAEACERTFSGRLRSPVTERTKYLHGVCNVAAALVKIME
ncbi:hypothetical protein Nepgr_023889 [Nepenthes gracilis]|uniref:Pectinesterase inhibitor domain-containing protein n=1 Tax=Nepenthes gracilis TaxID=150966 RepID=A0AAD3T3N7_NEPGR|nr:hypothetical protein Nepgr_023889 [Nepenthes gracilis]